MRDVVYLDQIEQAEALLKPQRIEVLRQLAEPRSCTEVAVELDQTPQRVYYHVKRLLEAFKKVLDNFRKELEQVLNRAGSAFDAFTQELQRISARIGVPLGALGELAGGIPI